MQSSYKKTARGTGKHVIMTKDKTDIATKPLLARED